MYHETNTEDDGRAKGVHAIKFENTTFKEDWENSKQHKIWKAKNNNNPNVKYKVNSLHHQCVSGRNFPEELEIIARYDGDKNFPSTIEAVRHRTLPIYCVQYHPEEMGYDFLTDFIIEEKLLYKFKEENE